MSLEHPRVHGGAASRDLNVDPLFTLEGVRVPRHELPTSELPPDVAYQIIHDELMLDGNARLNVATFVSTWMEPQAENGSQCPSVLGEVRQPLGRRDAPRTHGRRPSSSLSRRGRQALRRGTDLAALRVVVRRGFTHDPADLLANDLERQLVRLQRQPAPVHDASTGTAFAH